MNPNAVSCMTDGLDEVVRRACLDRDFRQQLLDKPEAALAELGVALHKGQQVLVVDFAQDTPPPLVLHLPPFGAEVFVADAYTEGEFAAALGQNKVKE